MPESASATASLRRGRCRRHTARRLGEGWAGERVVAASHRPEPSSPAPAPPPQPRTLRNRRNRPAGAATPDPIDRQPAPIRACGQRHPAQSALLRTAPAQACAQPAPARNCVREASACPAACPGCAARASPAPTRGGSGSPPSATPQVIVITWRACPAGRPVPPARTAPGDDRFARWRRPAAPRHLPDAGGGRLRT